MRYIIQWEEQDPILGSWVTKTGATNIYPVNLVIGWIAANAKSGTRWFKVIENPTLSMLFGIKELPDNEIIKSFYSR